MVGCAVLSVVPRVGVPPSPCVGAGACWARPGVVLALSGLGCGGASWWACASGLVSLVPRCGSVPRGSPGVDWVWMLGRCRSIRRGASLLGGCVSWPLSSRPPLFLVLWPMPFSSPSVGGPPVVPCPRVVLPPMPCSRGCVPVTLRLSSPPCRGPSLCPFPFRCPGGGVEARSMGRRSPCLGLCVLEPPVEGFGGARKSHYHVFLGGVDPGQAPPKSLLLMLKLT